jgi:hypothetical protein
VLMLNVALLAPGAMVTLDGTLATPGLLLESEICTPPDGAGPLSVTVPRDEFPPVTLVGFKESEEREIAGRGSGDCSKSQMAGFGSFSGTATNFDGEIVYITAVPPAPELIVIVPLPFVGEDEIE